MVGQKPQKGIHRAWFVLIGCCMVQSATSGIINNVGHFYRPIAEAFSTATNVVGVKDVALGRTYQMIVSALFIFFVGRKLIEKYYKPVLLISSILYPVHYLALTYCKSVNVISIIQGLGGMPLSFLQSLCIVMTLNKWFYKKKGLALSISSAFAGLTSIIYSAITGNIIEKYGWQAGFKFFAAITFVLSIVGTMVFMVESPEAVGEKPYGWDDEAEQRIKLIKENAASTPKTSIWRRPQFWLIMFLHCSFSFLMTSTAHTSSYATSIGYGIVASAYISSIGLAGNTSMKLVVGELRDKKGSTKSALTELTLAGIGYLLLLLNPSVAQLFIGVFLVGSVMATTTVISPILESEHFKGADFVFAYPFITMVGNFCGSLANYFYGWVCDTTGSYAAIFKICIVLIILDAAAVLLLEKKYKPKHPAI